MPHPVVAMSPSEQDAAMTYQPTPDQTPKLPPDTSWVQTTTVPAPAKPRTKLAIVIAAVVVLAAVLGFAAYLAFGRNSGPTLTAAEQECNRGRSGGDLADGGKTLMIDLRGTSPAEQIRGAMDADTFGCIMAKLEVPSAVTAHVQGTRALDGQQTDAWGDFSARWTYHPDHGLQMTIEQR